MLTPNGKQIVFNNYHHSYLWNYRDNSLLTIEGRCLDILPDGGSIITHADGSILLHDKNGSELPCSNTNSAFSTALSKDGNKLAISDVEHLDIFDLDGWESYSGRDIHGSKSTPSCQSFVDVSSDRQYFLADSAESGYYEIWDVELGQPIRQFPGSAKSLKLKIESIAFSQDEMLMATLDVSQGTIHIWDIDSFQIIDTLSIPSHAQPRRPLNFKASPTLQYFAYALWDENIFLFDRSRPISLEFLTGTSNREDFTFSSDEEYMIISRELNIFHFNLTTEKHRTITLQETPENPGSRRIFMYFTSNSDIGLYESSAFLMGTDRNGYVWDASSGQLLHPIFLDYPDTSIESFIPSHQYLFTSTSSCTRVLGLDLREDWIRFSSNEQHSLRSLPRGSSATLCSNDWVITQNDEFSFWVPQDYHQRLHIPKLKYMIRMKPTELDLSSFSHGQS
ncbi:hypothetical protein Clacol_005269 [Clathrus columnatus]|uniref:WD40 repeat domain-containing protein n=1 Tax=Clathrus columnatus TaxID=1419009 RepID=A0AAV5AED8_9AGAM|nr:hypothetical protein Clacol_005269 [Clathrus columnatus]